MTVSFARAVRSPGAILKMSRRYSCILLLLCFIKRSDSTGASCNQNGVPGQCSRLRDCPSALANPSTRWNLKRCGFEDREPIICCLDRSANPVATPAPMKYTTPLYVPPLNEYSDLRAGEEKCAPISPSLTSEKTGRKAFDKCIEYQEQLLYPCERGVDFLGKLTRVSYCNHKVDELIVGGQEAKRDEFPHMALLSFEPPSPDGLICGGTIISERFILTAGHCTSKGKSKPATATVGLLRREESAPASRVHRIKRIIKHPEFKPPSKYNDIALLETETPIKLDSTVIPACLDTGETVDDSRASITGWGNTAYLGKKSDILLKVTLTKFAASECSRRYRPSMKYLHRGYDNTTQLCYGDHTAAKDTCQGDSGGPLQIHSRIHCMYTVIGVTSYGKGCGAVGYPGVYSRVAAYTPWIESVVWP